MNHQHASAHATEGVSDTTLLRAGALNIGLSVFEIDGCAACDDAGALFPPRR